jgi:lysophospholipase L1-like esterase
VRACLGLLGRIAAAAAIFLGAGELAARATGILDRLNGYTRLLYAPGPDADLPYVLRPGMETVLRGVPIRVNRLGLRGPETGLEPARGVMRVLVVGDSVVFGQEMPEEQTLAQALRRRLDAGGRGPTEVLNAGVSGYDAVAALRFLETYGLRLRPAVVVVGVSLNDHDVAPQFSADGMLLRKDLERRAPDLADRSEFLTLLRWLVRWSRGELMVQRQAVADARHEGPPGMPPPAFNSPAMVAAIRELRLAFYHDPVPAYWDRLRAAFAGFGRLASRQGVGLLVAIFPESYQVGTADPDLTPQRRLLDVCREADLPCLDLQPVFARAGGDLFVDVSHPNARGHELAAAAIADALSRAD